VFPELQHRRTATAELIPVSFHGHAGMLHRPADRSQHRPTLLLCGALGRDARCSYRPLFLWANTLACRGFQVLRYDHLGEGDSQSVEDGADQWSRWLRGVTEAAAFARAEAPAQQLIVGGLRIGATLAVAAAQAIRPHGLMLLAPFANARAWLRELTLAAAMQGNAPEPVRGLEVDGLRLSAATVATLEDSNHLAEATDPAWHAAFLASAGPKDALAKNLGPNLTEVAFSGYPTLFKEAHLNELPIRVFEQATAWLERLAMPAPAATAADLTRTPLPKIGAPSARLRSRDWLEEPVCFGGGLRGVLCLPTRAVSSQAVIFGNTAGDPRAGVGGFATKACRALAAAGIGALRYDFLGLGESAAQNGWRSHIYETPRIDDFHRAADLLQDYGYADVTVAGVCAGGYHAVQAALEDSRFPRAIAINSWLIWRPDGSLEVPRALPTRFGAVFQQSAWLRLMKGDIKFHRVAAGVALRARQAWASRRPDRFCQTARTRFVDATRRGVRIGLIYGQGDAAMQGAEADFGRGVAWLRRLPGVRLAVLPGVDHPLFSRASRKLVCEEIIRILKLPEYQATGGKTADETDRWHTPLGTMARPAVTTR
jgi:hypothetical protein